MAAGAELRWNKFVSVGGTERDDTVVIQSWPSHPLPGAGVMVGPTPLLQQLRDNFTALIVPFGVAAAFFGPASETVRRKVRVTSGTTAPFVVFADALEDQWTLRAELLQADDVRELERLWTLPYPGPIVSDFRVSD